MSVYRTIGPLVLHRKVLHSVGISILELRLYILYSSTKGSLKCLEKEHNMGGNSFEPKT